MQINSILRGIIVLKKRPHHLQPLRKRCSAALALHLYFSTVLFFEGNQIFAMG